MEAEPPPTDFDGPSVRALIGQLISDTKDYARAEMEFVRAEVGDRSSHIGPAIGLMAAAAVMLFGALVAALVGITFWIGQSIGLGWAILIVTCLVALLAYALVRAGQRHLQQVTRPWEKP